MHNRFDRWAGRAAVLAVIASLLYTIGFVGVRTMGPALHGGYLLLKGRADAS
ncbi:MAG TPA: hypothetical protein VM284_07440 [Candidatus Limnocylindria bacterium]|nr:hypothetical protein [Candidatus Limnocylindria bacterium]